jgi:hypothetical protein
MTMSDALRDAATLIRRHAPAADRVRLAAVADWLEAEAVGDPLNPVAIIAENLELTSETDQLRSALEDLLTGSAGSAAEADPTYPGLPVGGLVARRSRLRSRNLR